MLYPQLSIWIRASPDGPTNEDAGCQLRQGPGGTPSNLVVRGGGVDESDAEGGFAFENTATLWLRATIIEGIDPTTIACAAGYSTSGPFTERKVTAAGVTVPTVDRFAITSEGWGIRLRGLDIHDRP